VLQATCGLTAEPLDAPANHGADGELVVAVISLVGDVEWLLDLCLPRETAVGLAARFAGFPIPYESEDMGDAVGELSNILAGKVKAALDGLGVRAEIGLPAVLRGDRMEVLVRRGAPAATMGFATECGEVCVRVIADANAKGGA